MTTHEEPAYRGGLLNSWTFGLMADERLRREFPGAEPTTNTLLLFLNRASADLTSILEAEVHKPLGLSWSGYRLLFVLWVAGDLEPARVAELTHTSRASVSSLSMSFIEQGLIDRRPSETDGRSVLLSLTEKGADLVRRAYLAQDARQRELFSTLTEAEQEILYILLSKMMESRGSWLG
jgi:MarR family transcriptional regulator, negative regulator of the multidrug operon emrRAB